MEPAHFLNVDLDVKCRTGIPVLTAALPAVADDIREGTPYSDGLACYKILDEILTPEQAITCFGNAHERITDDARAVWNTAETREFSIGIQSGLQPHWSQWQLSPRLLSRVAALNTELSAKVYAPEQTTNGAKT